MLGSHLITLNVEGRFWHGQSREPQMKRQEKMQRQEERKERMMEEGRDATDGTGPGGLRGDFRVPQGR